MSRRDWTKSEAIRSCPGDAGGVAGSNERELVGEDHRLDAAAHAELQQQVAHVALHRGLAQEELGRELTVRSSSGEADEDLALAPGQVGHRSRWVAGR